MSRLDLRELQILAMPGFETGGFRVAELVAGLNVITGPNGAGKTTTARAIRCLLWPEASHLKELRPALEAVAALDDRELRLSARDLQVTVSAAGAPHPPLGDPATASRYWLSLADLLANDSADLAALVARETHGGYSLAEAAKVLGANPNPRRQNAVSGFLKSSREQLRAAELADSEVAQQAQRLELLRAAQAEAAAAHRQAQQLAAALQYLPCREAARHA
ncbi:MAG: AAA family ATPase, partial [Armatimonadetes bacterium]|nr:AAA family ATPase [Armatimonadota bacterium]